MGEFEEALEKRLSGEQLKLAKEILATPTSRIRELIEQRVQEALSDEG